jgi:hypothetical protein
VAALNFSAVGHIYRGAPDRTQGLDRLRRPLPAQLKDL